MERKRLSDILRGRGSGDDWINKDWSAVPPAPDFGSPVPKAYYIAHILEGALFNAATGSPGYKVSFEIIEGEYKGRRQWYNIWLTAKAQRQAVRDFAKLGIRSKEQLEQPIPTRQIRCRIFVVIHKGDDGIDRNVVKSFEVLGIDPPEVNPFAPVDDPEGGPGHAADSKPDDDTEDSPAGNSELFPFGANAPSAEGPYQEGR